MNINSDAHDPRFDRRRVTATSARDTPHLESTQATQRQDDAQHSPSNNNPCLCPTCHLKHFPRRHDGRILLPPPVPFRKGRSASSLSVPYTQSAQLVGSEQCIVGDGNESGSMPRTASAAGILVGPGKGCCSPPPLFTENISITAILSTERDKTRRKTTGPSGSSSSSHATEPYPSGVRPKSQRYAVLKQGGPQSGAERSSTTYQLAAPSDTPLFHERQPFSQLFVSLPQLGLASVQPRLAVPSEVSLEQRGPASHTTSRTLVSSRLDALLPTDPSIGSDSRDTAVMASLGTPRPPSPPGERPPSRFFRFRPELFDQYVEVSGSYNVSIEATHMSYQDHCDVRSGESAAGTRAAAVMPEPSASQGARSPQPPLHIAHATELDALSERIDIGALSFQKAVTPPKQPATAKAAASSSSRQKRNRSPDNSASSSAVQVKWDSERKQRQKYLAQDDGNEKSPFRHYTQTSCNFDP